MRQADAVTLLGAFTGSLALAAGVYGDLWLAVRLLFIAYTLDVLDGVIARREGATREGFMLDRAVDRFTQVIVPSILLLLYEAPQTPRLEYALYAAYTASLVTLGFYRLVYRRVESLNYFSGLPLLTHALVILAGIMALKNVSVLLLYYLLALSLLPISYYRRPSSGGKRSFPASRIIGSLLLAVIPYGGLIAELIYWLVIVGVLVYSIGGALVIRRSM
ncbi:MAG: CDP-alcohol phosphatidyltransferase family protein [Desulfurococcales archaeon]|nr:CDP-alcohol phosphatidyltransferase family protein [Desulfurococcales archaeon]